MLPVRTGWTDRWNKNTASAVDVNKTVTTIVTAAPNIEPALRLTLCMFSFL